LEQEEAENMKGANGHASPSGVWIADDFRSNLIIDRYDPIFADMRASKIKRLRSANSEDAVTWNVFRSLRQIEPDVWLPLLWSRAFDTPVPEDLNTAVTLWKNVPPPLGLLADGDEGPSEIDVVIEAPSWVWFVEAKYRGDISTRTTTRPARDQVLRNLDVGTHYADVRSFYFSLLIVSDRASPLGVERLREYSDFNLVRKSLAHRTDGILNLKAIGKLTWLQLAEVLAEAENVAIREDERAYASRALEWLRARVLAPE
jgi:hypothetical protein